MKTNSKWFCGVAFGLLLTLANGLYAQQIPLYSQYYFNKFLYNPALTGHNGNLEGTLFGRRQYVNIDGYQTSGIAMQGQTDDGKMGLGVYYINDANQLLKTNSVYGNYAYNLKLSSQSALSFGFAMGVMNNQFNLNNIITTDPDDPILRLLDRPSGAALDASIGLNFMANGFNFGISMPQFLSNSQKFTDHYNSTVTYDLQNHLTIMASYDIMANEYLKIQPLILYKNTANSPGQVDINVMADWMNKGWLGLGIRDGYGISFMGGLRIADAVRFGYAYDVSTGQYSTALGGSHEFMIGAVIGRDKKDDKYTAEMAAAHEALQQAQDKKLKAQQEEIDALEKRVESLSSRPSTKDTVFIAQAPRKSEEAVKPKDKPSTGNPKEVIGDKTAGEFLVIAGSFSTESNATIYFNQLVNKGLSPYMYIDKKTNAFYVHLGKFYFKEDAREYMQKNTTGDVKLWVKTL